VLSEQVVELSEQARVLSVQEEETSEQARALSEQAESLSEQERVSSKQTGVISEQEEFSSAQEEKPSEQSESSSAQAEASSTLEGVASSPRSILFIPKNTPFLSIKKCPIMQKRLYPPIPDNREANILSVLVGIS